MLAKDVVAAIIRVFALSLIFKSLANATTFYALDRPVELWILLAAVLISLILFVVLWVSSYRISSWLLPTKQPIESSPLGAATLESIAISLLGIYFLWQGVSGLFYWLSFYFMAASQGISLGDFNIEQKAGFVTTIFELVVGIAFLAGLRSIIKGVRWLRTAGLSQNG